MNISPVFNPENNKLRLLLLLATAATIFLHGQCLLPDFLLWTYAASLVVLGLKRAPFAYVSATTLGETA
jgi:hypothetical protein